MSRPERIRYERKARGLTQRDVAGAIGVSVRTVQQWEAGTIKPRNHNALRLMRLLGLDAEDLA